MSPLVLTFIITALQALPSIIAAGGDLAVEANTLKTQIQTFVDQKRDPTPDEWAAQGTALVAALNRLAAHNAQLVAAKAA